MLSLIPNVVVSIKIYFKSKWLDRQKHPYWIIGKRVLQEVVNNQNGRTHPKPFITTDDIEGICKRAHANKEGWLTEKINESRNNSYVIDYLKEHKFVYYRDKQARLNYKANVTERGYALIAILNKPYLILVDFCILLLFSSIPHVINFIIKLID